MASQVLYRKWRPRNLAEVAGQEPVTQTLRNALRSGRISHAYLFCGPRGTGKTSTARSLAKAINCMNPQEGEPCNECEMCQSINENRALDVIEIDAASNTGVDDIRALKEKVNYAPNQARYKVYIIDEVHMLSNSASNALLKTLEEPPQHVVFILATTEVHKILATILSRCQRFDFRRLSQNDVVNRLMTVSKGEEIEIEKDALNLIAKSATGSLRDAINLLDRLATYYGSGITLQQVQAILGITGDMRTRELVRQIVNRDVAAGLATINGVNNDGLDLKQFNRELVEYLRGLLLIKTGSGAFADLVAEDLAELEEIAKQTPLELVLTAIRLFSQLELGFDNYPTLPLELALVDCILAADGRPLVQEPSTVPAPAPPVKAETKPASEKKPEPSPETKPVSEAKQPQPKPEPAPAPEKRSSVVEEAIEDYIDDIIDDSMDDFEPEPETVPTPAPKKEPVKAREQAPAPPKAAAPPPAPKQQAPAPAPRRIPTPEPKKEEAAGSALPGADELERLKINWKRVMELAPAETKKSPAIAILRSAGVSPISIDGSKVVLSFRHKYLKEKIEALDNCRVAEKIISNFLGRPCTIACVEENNHLLKAALKMGAQIIDQEEK